MHLLCYRFSVCPSSRQGFNDECVQMPCGVFMKSHQDRAFKGSTSHPRGTKKSKSENEVIV